MRSLLRAPGSAVPILLFGLFWLSIAAPSCGARTSLPAPDPAQRDGTCGDRVVFGGEACDDGNAVSTDACVEGCSLATCGDGFVRAGFEACDDGNADNLDACRSNCARSTCGDGVVDQGEECDDANGIASDACPSLCLFARCGDGFVHEGVEECDAGAANGDVPAFLLTQGDFSRPIAPIMRPGSVESFYAYASASSHTGFEAAGGSRLFLYRDLETGALSLVTHHGIDIDSTGIDQPKGSVKQTFSFLPSGVFVAISDDTTGELSMAGDGSAKGDWTFHHNTDGGALSGLASPGSWSIDIDSTFEEGIEALAYVDAAGDLVPLETSGTVSITAYPGPSPCRLDCTVPRCGDGIVDGGELCDDGNVADGDDCPADCN
jgi:cysteine-rich repeat protein